MIKHVPLIHKWKWNKINGVKIQFDFLHIIFCKCVPFPTSTKRLRVSLCCTVFFQEKIFQRAPLIFWLVKWYRHCFKLGDFFFPIDSLSAAWFFENFTSGLNNNPKRQNHFWNLLWTSGREKNSDENSLNKKIKNIFFYARTVSGHSFLPTFCPQSWHIPASRPSSKRSRLPSWSAYSDPTG